MSSEPFSDESGCDPMVTRLVYCDIWKRSHQHYIFSVRLTTPPVARGTANILQPVLGVIHIYIRAIQIQRRETKWGYHAYTDVTGPHMQPCNKDSHRAVHIRKRRDNIMPSFKNAMTSNTKASPVPSPKCLRRLPRRRIPTLERMDFHCKRALSASGRSLGSRWVISVMRGCKKLTFENFWTRTSAQRFLACRAGLPHRCSFYIHSQG